jgi:GntR family transcriptional repressor for pyruvate dehydrogenase complex
MTRLKVSKYTLADQVYDQIKEEILSGQWQAGQKLPSEHGLCEIYGVSRLTIRIALQKLNALGLVRTRAGEGSFVIKFDAGKYFKELSSSMVKSGTVRDVLDFRKLIELESTRLIVKNCNDKEIDELESLCVQFFEMLTNAKYPIDNEDEIIEQLVNADYNIHLKICELSKNPLFSLSYMAAQDPIKQYLRIILVSRLKIFDEVLKISREKDGHLRLCDALRARDARKCKSILFKIMDYKYLPESLKEETNV